MKLSKRAPPTKPTKEATELDKRDRRSLRPNAPERASEVASCGLTFSAASII